MEKRDLTCLNVQELILKRTFQLGNHLNNRPIETSIEGLSQLIKEGKFDHIGLSEVSAASIRRAHKIHPISTVEIEYSLWSIEAKHNGVLSTCKELGITVIAYSPLGRGILTGKWTKPEDIPPLLRQRFPRYSDENFETNSKFVHFLNEMAQRKGVTPAQLAINWILTEGDHIIPIPGATALSRVQENMGASGVELTKEELKEINQFVEKAEVKGTRYFGPQNALLWG
jgi:pyridoxine 4-dehydrogenase